MIGEILMDRTIFSLEIFGDRMKPSDFMSSGTNEKQVRYLKNQLKKAMDTELTEKQRDILTEFYFEGKSVTEISDELGVNKSTVSRHLKRSKEKLRTVLSYGFIPIWTQ